MTEPQPVLELGPSPAGVGAYLREMRGHVGVLRALARLSFQVNYKRATLGLAWTVAIPLLQSAMLAVVFSIVAKFEIEGVNLGAYVMSGVLPWAYFSNTIGPGSTAIVDGTALADKVWFPRLILPLVPVLSNLVQLGVSMVVMVSLMPVLDTGINGRIVLLIPAIVLLVTFTGALTAVLSVVHVYVRDIRHLVQAGVLLWFYATPIFYPAAQLPRVRWLLDLNPMTGVITMFRLATVDHESRWERPLAVSVATTLALVVLALELHRRHDRQLVDRL